MGSDFLKEQTERKRKGWRDGRNKLKQPRLDDRVPPPPERVVKLAGRPQSSLKIGDRLVIQQNDQRLVAYSGLARVAEASDASPTIQRAVALSHGMATARVCRVDRSSGTVEAVVDCGADPSEGKPH